MPPIDQTTTGLPETGHFPNHEELLRLQDGWGLHPALDPEAVAVRFDRHLATLPPQPGAAAGEEAWPNLVPADTARDFIIQLAGSLTRTRVDHRKLSQAEKDAFNTALKAAHAAGTYKTLADIHGDMSHRMHSMSGPIGTQRFLPWHRRYTLQAENLLRSVQPADGAPALTIPYWDYADDHARPDWVWRPPNVTRGVPGANGGSLPTQTLIDSLLLRPRYTPFTSHLETDAHNDVHNWCNGTISDIMAAPHDPLFWLLHANVDRIWDRWQLNHTGKPSLSGNDAVLDPWADTATDVAGTIALGYSYG